MPNEGQPNSEYPGCLWSNRAQDWVCDDGYYLNSGLPVPDGGFTTADPFGGSGRQITLSGAVYVLPSNVAFPPDGWYVWSELAAEQWVVSVGGQRRDGPTPSLNDLAQQQQQAAPTQQQVDQWRSEQEALNTARNPDGTNDLATLVRIAKSGGAGAAGALATLSANGDLIAKLALTLGIGYGIAAILPWAGGGLVVLAFLFKK
jgi:hypothetical protein